MEKSQYSKARSGAILLFGWKDTDKSGSIITDGNNEEYTILLERDMYAGKDNSYMGRSVNLPRSYEPKSLYLKSYLVKKVNNQNPLLRDLSKLTFNEKQQIAHQTFEIYDLAKESYNLKELKTMENTIIGQDFINIIKNLTNEERNLLLNLSNNVIDKAKKRGFPTYVNVNNYYPIYIIQLCIKHNHQNITAGGGKPEYHFMRDFKYKEERGVKINDKLEFDVTTGQYDGDWDESTISTAKYLSFFEEKLKEGGAIKTKGTFKPLGTSKELGITPKIAGHDMIAKCDCEERFSYQNSKNNILWQCPECNEMKRITSF